MGSATRDALEAAKAALADAGSVDLATVQQIFFAGQTIGSSAQLVGMLADSSTDAETKRAIVAAVFGKKVGDKAAALLAVVVDHRWSSENELLGGIEELGLRAAAESAPKTVSVESELFAFKAAVLSNAELELSLGSKQGTDQAKSELIEALLGGKASGQTIAILEHLVVQPRGRRINELIDNAASVIADQAGRFVATVTSATPIAAAQLKRLQTGLTASFGRELTLNLIVDPSIIGGLRVQVGSDVIDGSVSRKLNELRLQLAG